MRIRKRPAPALLLLLPVLPVFAASLPNDSDGKQLARAVPVQEYPAVSTLPQVSPPIKPDVGTKDAPVDGLDGKPHKGPFVEGKPKKPAAGVEELLPAATKPPISSKKLPKEELLLPENDGVMDDPNRVAPEKGTTGTEGGVSAKDRDRKKQEDKTGEKVEKIPDPPKEAPPLPHGEQERVKDKTKTQSESSTRKLGAVGLEKPTDLPESPHDIPHPVPPTLPKDDPLDTKHPSKGSDSKPSFEDDDDVTGVIQPFHSFILSLTMILFSEVGDKTFLVAALMAMRHPRALVFSAAFSALIAMTVLSAVLGHTLPSLLPKRFTNFAAAILFLVFGAKLLREGLAMSPDEGVGEELKEVEMELEEKEHLARRSSRRRSSISPYVLEAGRARRSRSNSRLPTPARSPSSSPSRSPSPSGSSITGLINGLYNLFSLLLSPAWVQTFVMTFLGEWGDRSQIATIAMAAGQDYWWVTGGAISGHAVCTAAAVVGGRAIAGKVSMRVVTLGGAFAFLVFGIIYLLEALYSG
ncbi:UPF0016-domain-containing protein [Lepidopterella palustris CBS 459.81]|uniref:UPF0016-domain-containing protein n=1 Tax=Lepidopterella palustris CBS 459.81 TaxID=1314670 RepID=A0A8E2EM32_9PEZI|nr:UPF0016-domain-containing protein [Lepidopterella palustris CBS 459.81]